MQEFDARRYIGGAVDGQPIRIAVNSDVLQISVSGAASTITPLTDFDVKLGGNTGRRVVLTSRATGDTILVDDIRLLDELKAALPYCHDDMAAQLLAARQQIKDEPKKEATWWIVTVGLVAAVALSIFAGVDIAVSIAEKQVPPATERSFGIMGIESGVKAKKYEQNSERYKRVKKIGDRLLAKYKDNPYSFEFYIKPDNEINAQARPGGVVIVNSKLVDAADTDDELAGVLAHEIGHVKKRHSLKAALRKAGLFACITCITGTPSKEQIDLIGTAINLEDLQFSRAQELEADDISVELCSASGYRPDAIISFFERIEKEDPLSNQRALSMMSTHPMPEERIAHIKSLVAKTKTNAKAKARTQTR